MASQAARTNEFPPCTWSELTSYEKREALERGFPTCNGWPSNDVRYVAKRRYNQDAGELSLDRFVRVRVVA